MIISKNPSTTSEESKTEQKKSSPNTPKGTVVKTSSKSNVVVVNKVKDNGIRYASSCPIIVPKSSLESNLIHRDRGINADIVLAPNTFAFLYAMVQKYPSTEINGFGHISPELLLDWVSIVQTGTSGSVTSTPEGMAWATTECIKAVGAAPNMQLHTHPGFDTFYSATDTSDIADYVRQTRDGLDVEYGEMRFMVFNMKSWLIRKIEWSPDGVFYNDGVASYNGITFANTTRQSQSFGTKSYSTVKPVKKPTTPAKVVKPTPPAKKTNEITEYDEYYGLWGYDGSYWEDDQFLPNPGSNLDMTNHRPPSKEDEDIFESTVFVLHDDPFGGNMSIIESLKEAYVLGEDMLVHVNYCSFLDLLTIKTFLENTGDTKEIWRELEKGLFEAAKANDKFDPNTPIEYSKTFMKEALVSPAIEIISLFDSLDWPSGTLVLNEMRKEDPTLVDKILQTSHEYALAPIAFNIDENVYRSKSDASASTANKALLDKIPSGPREVMISYMYDVEDSEYVAPVVEEESPKEAKPKKGKKK